MQSKAQKTMWITFPVISTCTVLLFLAITYWYLELKVRVAFAEEQVGIFASMTEKAEESDISALAANIVEAVE